MPVEYIYLKFFYVFENVLTNISCAFFVILVSQDTQFEELLDSML